MLLGMVSTKVTNFGLSAEEGTIPPQPDFMTTVKLIKKKRILIPVILIGNLLFSHLVVVGQVMTGAQQTGLYLPLLKDRSVGILANQASVVFCQIPDSADRTPVTVNIVDTLYRAGVKIVRIFSPEHGFRIHAPDGAAISDFTDSLTGIPVTSLYGRIKSPDSSQLRNIDIMVFDIQDVGVRFYTYISTLAYLMQACADHGKPLLVLDRPNPNGFYVDGPVLESGFESFVGMHPVPVVYGMTIGEYALMVNGEGWLKGKAKCDLTVIPVSDYTHHTKWNIPVPPSPNLPDMDAVLLYPSTCFFEGTIMSLGRGTPFPFRVYGHPAWPDTAFSFTPVSIPGKSINPPHLNHRCFGVDLRDTLEKNPQLKEKICISWLIGAWNKMGRQPQFFNDYFEKLAGTGLLKSQIIDGVTENEIRDTWEEALIPFREKRRKYLLYPE